MTSEFCMEALISGVLLASNVNLVHEENGLKTINQHPYVLSSYSSKKELCKKERVAFKDNNFNQKINIIE